VAGLVPRRGGEQNGPGTVEIAARQQMHRGHGWIRRPVGCGEMQLAAS
jgi:hypothetical protein